MRICVVADVLGKQNNGTSVAAWNLIRYLKLFGHEVRVLCPEDEYGDREGFYTVPTGGNGPIARYIRKNGVSLGYKDEEKISAALAGVDEAHIMMPLPLGLAALKECLRMEIPVSAGFHCQAENITNHLGMMNSPSANDMVYRLFYRKFYRYCDAVHYPSEFIRRIFESRVGATPGYVISNGVGDLFRPLPTPPASDGIFTVTYAARYSKEKNHKLLIDGIAKSRFAFRIQAVFAGEGPLEEEIRAYAITKLPIKPIMRTYNRHEMVTLLQNTHIYAHVSDVDIEPISCMEAIASGAVPLISDSPLSGANKFAQTNANLFQHKNAENFAEKLDAFLEDDFKRNENRAIHIASAEKFRQGECMKKMEAMILQTAEKKKPLYAQV